MMEAAPPPSVSSAQQALMARRRSRSSGVPQALLAATAIERRVSDGAVSSDAMPHPHFASSSSGSLLGSPVLRRTESAYATPPVDASRGGGYSEMKARMERKEERSPSHPQPSGSAALAAALGDHHSMHALGSNGERVSWASWLQRSSRAATVLLTRVDAVLAKVDGFIEGETEPERERREASKWQDAFATEKMEALADKLGKLEAVLDKARVRGTLLSPARGPSNGDLKHDAGTQANASLHEVAVESLQSTLLPQQLLPPPHPVDATIQSSPHHLRSHQHLDTSYKSNAADGRLESTVLDMTHRSTMADTSLEATRLGVAASYHPIDRSGRMGFMSPGRSMTPQPPPHQAAVPSQSEAVLVPIHASAPQKDPMVFPPQTVAPSHDAARQQMTRAQQLLAQVGNQPMTRHSITPRSNSVINAGTPRMNVSPSLQRPGVQPRVVRSYSAPRQVGQAPTAPRQHMMGGRPMQWAPPPPAGAAAYPLSGTPPPPAGGRSATSLLGPTGMVPPLPTGLWAPQTASLGRLLQDGVESKIREWLGTIPIGNGAERGWDDKQITDIAEFVRDNYLEHLPAEDMYRRYVEHTIMKAEES